MCGIAGVYAPGAVADGQALAAMVAALRHRGPDGEALWLDGPVGLGMRRLAIVDVAGGEQPLCSEDDTIKVVFNGEIYNHRALRAELLRAGHSLCSETDGEVIPHLYEEHGPAFVERLDGIFAFGLWDGRERRLLLARDQLGVKPLYFYAAGGAVRFASELKALLEDPAVPRRLDVHALDHHLTFRFTPAPGTLLAGVRKLEPATWAIFDDAGRERQARYWDPAPTLREDLTLDEAAGEFRERLRTAVHRQMMSDRPIGAMLSGGIDSAAVLAMMAERSTQVRTFTVGFEGGGDSDETPLARETARHFATEHHEIVLPASDFRSDLAATIEMLEEPVGTNAALGFREVSRLAGEASVPVLLSGQGADEVLAGYWRYVGEWIAGRALGLVGHAGMRRPLALVAGRTRSARLQRGLRALRHTDVLTRFLDIYAVFDEPGKAALYRPELRARLGADGRPRPPEVVERLRVRAAARDPLAQMMYVDTRLWLPDDLLLVGDKMSMAESIEMRVPFLDRELVEFVESLPTNYKLRYGQRKLVHKRAMTGLLPREIVHRRERGFATPIRRWLRDDLHEYARDLLLDGAGTCASLFERQRMAELLDRHRRGQADHTRQLFALVSIELWARRFLPAANSDGAGVPLG